MIFISESSGYTATIFKEERESWIFNIWFNNDIISSESSETVVRRCFVKKVVLKILQNSQENTCVRVSFLIKFRSQACKFRTLSNPEFRTPSNIWMESYRKIISSFRLLNIFANNSTLDVSQDSEYASENTCE